MTAGTADAILLAAGASVRFGADKLLEPFHGKPLARHVIESITGLQKKRACFQHIFLVAARAEVIALLRAEDGVTAIHNERPFLGQRESVRLGAERSRADYMLFVPCDQGLLDEDTVRRVLAAREPGKICRPCYQGVPGAPALFSAAFRAELTTLKEGQSGKDIIRRHPGAVIPVELPRAEPLIDFDTRDLFERYA